MDRFRFNERYQEYRHLRTGVPVLLRLIRASDGPTLLDGFRRLSPQSRYRRFLAYRRTLSPAEIDRFTRCDGLNHFALGALIYRRGQNREGIGVARFVRMAEDPAAAEVAVTVIDDYQGQGLGKLLLARLLSAAAERGIRELRSAVLAENTPMLALARSFGAAESDTDGRGVVDVVVPVVSGRARQLA